MGLRAAGLVRPFVILILLGAACTQPPSDPAPTPGPTLTAPTALRIGVGEVRSLDPAQLDGPDAVLAAAQVFDGLVSYDPGTGAVLPEVATGWDVRAGGRRFVFEIGEDAFHDGTPVLATDFVRAWSRLVDPASRHPFAFLLESVEGFRRHRLTFGARPFTGVRATGDRTLEVRLSVAWPDFVSVLGHPALSPVPAAVEGPEFARRPIGNGPYRLASDLAPDAPIDLEAVPGEVPAPRVGTVVLHPSSSPDEGWPPFLARDLDIAPIPGSELTEAIVGFGEEGIQPLGQLVYCGFNLREPELRPAALRTAASLALDRERLVAEAYGPLATPATGIVPPPIPGHRPDVCEGRCERDLVRARSLVDGLRPRARSFALDVSSSSAGASLGTLIRDQLADVGLDVEVRTHEPEAFAELLRAGEQAAFCLVWVTDYPRQRGMLEPLLLSSSPENRTGVSDPDLDALLLEARAESDPIVREELMVDAERRALELLPVIPVAWFRSNLAAQPYIGGFVVDPTGSFDVSTITVAP